MGKANEMQRMMLEKMKRGQSPSEKEVSAFVDEFSYEIGKAVGECNPALVAFKIAVLENYADGLRRMIPEVIRRDAENFIANLKTAPKTEIRIDVK